MKLSETAICFLSILGILILLATTTYLFGWFVSSIMLIVCTIQTHTQVIKEEFKKAKKNHPKEEEE